MRRLTVWIAAAGVALLAAGCSSSAASGGAGGDATGTAAKKVVLRLGFLENITHAPALIGVKNGFFTKNLGPDVTLQIQPYSTGTEEATALLAGQLDAAYVGPNPTISTWQKSGGSQLVVKNGITSANQLKGQKLATPSLGNTQDVALRYWLKTQGLSTTSTGGGDVPVTPVTPNSAAVLQFQSGQLAGGWEPAPYDAEMVADGGHVLVDEASLWPGGRFVTTDLVVTQTFLAANPTVVNNLLKGQIEANSYIASNKSAAETAANVELAALTGKGLKSSALAASFDQVTFTNDPIESSLLADAQHAVTLDLLQPVSNLRSIYDLGPLNALLKADGQSAVGS